MIPENKHKTRFPEFGEWGVHKSGIIKIINHRKWPEKYEWKWVGVKNGYNSWKKFLIWEATQME